jgi:ribosomal protein S12 methylthiotransferase accessory factor
MVKEMTVTFPGNMRVDAEYKGFTIRTDQAKYAGGDGTAPQPYDLFLVSIATCSGIFVVFFCQQRGIPYEDIRIVMRTEKNKKARVVSKFEIDIQLPAGFPEKYRKAIARSVKQCTIMRTMEYGPKFDVTTVKPGEG